MADIVFHNWLTQMANKEIDFDNDTLKVALLTSAYTPDVDHTDWSDLSANELGDGNGYTTGGVTVAGTVANDDSNDNAKFDIADPSWTASGGAIGPALYGVLYDTTTSTNWLAYLFDFSTVQTAQDGASFTIQIDTDGLFTNAQA